MYATYLRPSLQSLGFGSAYMGHRQLGRQVFKIAVISLAALGGLVECAALLRARLSGQVTGLRQS